MSGQIRNNHICITIFRISITFFTFRVSGHVISIWVVTILHKWSKLTAHQQNVIIYAQEFIRFFIKIKEQMMILHKQKTDPAETRRRCSAAALLVLCNIKPMWQCLEMGRRWGCHQGLLLVGWVLAYAASCHNSWRAEMVVCTLQSYKWGWGLWWHSKGT